MNARFFNQHTFEVKLNAVIDILLNTKGYIQDHAVICSLRKDDCHIDFVVAVYDKLQTVTIISETKKEHINKYLKEIREIIATKPMMSYPVAPNNDRQITGPTQ